MSTGTSELRYWIDAALECNRRDHTPTYGPGDQKGPFLSARALGMAMAALQCAYEGNGDAAIYKVAVDPAYGNGDPKVRAAAACHQVLCRRYPNQTGLLYPLWDTWVRLFKDGTAGGGEDEGRMIGDLVNDHINVIDVNGTPTEISDGKIADGKVPTGMEPPKDFRPPYMSTGLFDHDAPSITPKQGFAGHVWGLAEPLKAKRVCLAPPPGRTGAGPDRFDGMNAHYQMDLEYVLEYGGFHDGGRTGKQEVTGIFWGYDGPPELGTPPRLYMQVALSVLDRIHAGRELPAGEDDSLVTSIELKTIAAIAIAMADAGIDAWHYKYLPTHMLWRPALGIPHGKKLGWLPLGRPDTNGTGVGLTPDFPSYPSGHATFGAAAFQVLRLALVHQGDAIFCEGGEDNVRFTFTSDEYDGRNRDPRTGGPRPTIARTYNSLWKAIVDNSISRVFLGVHWQFDGITVKGTEPITTKGEFGEPKKPKDLGEIGGVWLGMEIGDQIAAMIGVPQGIIDASRGIVPS